MPTNADNLAAFYAGMLGLTPVQTATLSLSDLEAKYLAKYPKGFSGVATIYVSVKDYGAVGDGVTDDTLAIQNAINAASSANNGIVFFPTGIYLVSATLTITAGLSIQGAGMGGAIIRLKGSTAVTQIIGLTANKLNYSVTISDLQVDGNKGTAGTTATHGIYFFGASDCILERVRVVNVSGNGITLDGSASFIGTAAKLVNCYARTCGGNGLNITSNATDSVIENCDFGSCTGHAFYLGASNTSFIGSVGWGSNTGLFIDSTATLFWVTGCRFDNNNNYGLWLKGQNGLVGDTLVHDNSATATGTQPGVFCDSTSSRVILNNLRSLGAAVAGQTQQSYGLQLAAGRPGPTIATGCDFTGNATGAVNIQGSNAGDYLEYINGNTYTKNIQSPVNFSAIPTAVSATAGTNGALPAQAAGYMTIQIAGTTYKVPYFNN